MTDDPFLTHFVLFNVFSLYDYYIERSNSKKTSPEHRIFQGENKIIVCVHVQSFQFIMPSSVSDPDPDPYHLAGSGSSSGNVDLDPGT